MPQLYTAPTYVVLLRQAPGVKYAGREGCAQLLDPKVLHHALQEVGVAVIFFAAQLVVEVAPVTAGHLVQLQELGLGQQSKAAVGKGGGGGAGQGRA